METYLNYYNSTIVMIREEKEKLLYQLYFQEIDSMDKSFFHFQLWMLGGIFSVLAFLVKTFLPTNQNPDSFIVIISLIGFSFFLFCINSTIQQDKFITDCYRCLEKHIHEGRLLKFKYPSKTRWYHTFYYKRKFISDV